MNAGELARRLEYLNPDTPVVLDLGGFYVEVAGAVRPADAVDGTEGYEWVTIVPRYVTVDGAVEYLEADMRDVGYLQPHPTPPQPTDYTDLGLHERRNS